MLLIIIILISMNGCARQDIVIEYDVYFEYYLDKDYQYVIAGFPEEGKQQIELTIPETFNGKKVKRIGSYLYNNLESEKLERIYLYHVVYIEADDFNLCPNFKNLCIWEKNHFKKLYFCILLITLYDGASYGSGVLFIRRHYLHKRK